MFHVSHALLKIAGDVENMFHVSHAAQLFADTELRKDDVEQILDVDMPRNPSDSVRGGPQFLTTQLDR